MIKFLLNEIEKSTNALFSKKELLALSPEDFKFLDNKKILTYSRPDESEMEKVALPRCQHGCSLTIVPVDEGYEGVCLDHPEENPIPIETDDLNRYAFSIDTLLNQIRIANKIEGNLHTIDRRYYYVGYKMYDTQRTGFILISNISKEPLTSILGLKHLCREDNSLVVLTPYSKIEDVTLRASLFSNRIIQAALADCLNTQTFGISIETAIIELLRNSVDSTVLENKKTKSKKAIIFSKLNFRFADGQVFYNNKDIGLPTGRTQEILKKIIDTHPNVAKYDFLEDEQKEITSVSDQLKKDVSTINHTLKSKKVPYIITNKKTIGYIITNKSK